jgi:transglutaminase-like putative cysteine protease
LPDERSLQIGAAFHPSPYTSFSSQYSTSNLGAAGLEWMPGNGLAFRAGAYMDGGSGAFVSGIGVGVGWKYKFVGADAAFLHFGSQTNRQGSVNVNDFDPASITSIDLNRYTSDRVQLSIKAVFGNVREALATIEAVQLTQGVYPSAYEALAYRPIGTVRIKNISDKPIQARIRFFVDQYMDSPTESQPVYMLPGEVKDIPVKAVFNEKVRGVEQMLVREANVYVSATPAEDYDDKYATPVLIHGRNDWDGNAYSLRYFVTPDDPAVIRYTRDILLQSKDSLIAGDLEAFQKARVIFNAFSGKLVYVGDPKQSADYVQYPSETLQLRGGDCDDMTTCFSSLLNSVGISTAFIDVVPPEDSSKSHIYLLFDTGIDPKFGNVISSNPKRYVVRKNQKGAGTTVWIPIETTMITHGFEASWSQGAQEYFDDVEVGLGLIKGWVHIIDVY